MVLSLCRNACHGCLPEKIGFPMLGRMVDAFCKIALGTLLRGNRTKSWIVYRHRFVFYRHRFVFYRSMSRTSKACAAFNPFPPPGPSRRSRPSRRSTPGPAEAAPRGPWYRLLALRDGLSVFYSGQPKNGICPISPRSFRLQPARPCIAPACHSQPINHVASCSDPIELLA